MRRSFDLKPRKLPTQARARATNAAILEAAARILERDGFEVFTTNRVASVAGVGVASVYEYFPNKHAVVAAVITETVEDILAELDEALERALGQAPETALMSWVGAMFSAVEKRRDLTAVLLQEVPFLYEVPAVQALSRNLVKLAYRGRALGGRALDDTHAAALSRLLPPMVSSAVIHNVLWPPRAVPRSDLELALLEVLRPLVFPKAR